MLTAVSTSTDIFFVCWQRNFCNLFYTISPFAWFLFPLFRYFSPFYLFYLSIWSISFPLPFCLFLSPLPLILPHFLSFPLAFLILITNILSPCTLRASFHPSIQPLASLLLPYKPSRYNLRFPPLSSSLSLSFSLFFSHPLSFFFIPSPSFFLSLISIPHLPSLSTHRESCYQGRTPRRPRRTWASAAAPRWPGLLWGNLSGWHWGSRRATAREWESAFIMLTRMLGNSCRFRTGGRACFKGKSWL